MQYKLMIIESPGKLRKLREIMAAVDPAGKWEIHASVGHVRDLPSTGQAADEITTGVKKADFKPVYQLTDRGRDVVGKLKRIAANASEIYIATDPDREGEAIAWHLREALGLRDNYVRIAFNEISETRVREALASPRKIDFNLVGAQECRRVLDRLVGYRVSSELKRQTGESLSAGRVQSPAVYLVVQREREIKNFKPTTHYSAQLVFSGDKPDENWSAEWLTKPDFVTEDSPYFLDKQFAESVAALRDVSVNAFDESERLRNPPAPFTTSTLQQAASNALNLSPDATMKLAQALYEQGLISYHRTDNPNVSDEALPAITAVATALGLQVTSKRRTFKSKEGAQEGHPAITPTDWNLETAGETPEQQALYNLIRVRALASQLLPARYKVRKVQLTAMDALEGKKIEFSASGRVLIDPGWLKILGGDATADDDGEETPNPIPVLTAGQQLTASTGQLIERTTKAPKRYTEASLVRALESEGVGRPATFAAIMKNINTRNYVALKSRFLIPQPAGEKVVSLLEGNFSFLNIGYTKNLEDQLDLIAQGETRYKIVVDRLNTTLDAELATQQSSPAKAAPVYPCSECGKPMRRIAKGAHGAFWGCSGHPECNHTLPDAKGKPGQRKELQLSEHACPDCSKPLVHRVKKGKKGYNFWGCSGFPDCKKSVPDAGGKPAIA